MTNFPAASRQRLYFLFHEFEQDLQENLHEYVLDHLDAEVALGEEFNDAKRSQENDDSSSDIASFLGLRQAFTVLMRHRRELPATLTDDLSALAPSMPVITSIRNRVMHPTRPLLTDDSENAWAVFSVLESRFWRRTVSASRQLIDNPDFSPEIGLRPALSEGRLSNLPAAEYDETGLIGRDKEVTELRKLLLSDRYPIITITGEGGLGKTALATEVAHKLLEDPSSPFECILYVSLKTERLTTNGVEELHEAINSITGAEQNLTGFIDDAAAQATNELADFLELIPSLIVIDNLETVSGDDVIAFVERMPVSVKYLMTSRVGLGQMERRFPLEPLTSKDATYLFRRLVTTRRVSALNGLSDKVVENIVSELRSNPLSIRWYVQNIETGKPPLATLRDQKVLLEYCVKNVYENLSDGARKMITILRVLNRPVGVSELSLFFPEQPFDDVRRWSMELSKGALVQHSAATSGGLATQLALSATAFQFIPVSALDPIFAEEILSIEADFRASRESALKSSVLGFWKPTFVRTRDENDEPAAHNLRLALSFSKEGNVDKSENLVQKAANLAPDYWEVDRVAAYIYSKEGQEARASLSYREALVKAPDADAKAVTSYFYAGHLAYRAQDIKSALEMAETAYSLSDKDPHTAVLLGNCLTFANLFDRGRAVFSEATASTLPEIQNKAVAGLVENGRRHALDLLEIKNFSGAFEQAIEAFATGYDFWNANKNNADRLLVDRTADSMAAIMQIASRLKIQTSEQTSRVAHLYSVALDPQAPFQRSDKWKYVESYRDRFLYVLRKEGIHRPVEFEQVTTDQTTEAIFEGIVRKWDERGFGFISPAAFTDQVYFTKSAVVFNDEVPLIRAGVHVTFSDLESEPKGKRAMKVSIRN